MKRHNVLGLLNVSLIIICLGLFITIVNKSSIRAEAKTNDVIMIDYTKYDRPAIIQTIRESSEVTSRKLSELKNTSIEPLVAISVDEPYMKMNKDDIKELASLVYLEAGIESYECQKAVASVIINRMNYYGWTLQQVIYEPYQFEPAYDVPYTEPSESCVDAVKDVLQNGITVPEYVTYFRANYYFNWGDRYVNYKQIDNTYFSYDTWIKEECEKAAL